MSVNGSLNLIASKLRLSEAERALIKAEKSSERYSKMAGSGGADVQLDLDIVAGMGQ